MSSFRITTSMKMNTYRYNLNNSNTTLFNSSEKVQTHRKFNSYAESPADATHAWIIRRDMMNNYAYRSNNTDTYTRFQTGWLAMGNMKTHLEDATGRTSILRGLNDPTAAAKQELGGVLINTSATIIQTLNGAKYGEEYVFSGTDGATPPFSWDEQGRLLYRGINLTPPDYHAGWKDYNNPDFYAEVEVNETTGATTTKIFDADGNEYRADTDGFIYPVDEDGNRIGTNIYVDSTGQKVQKVAEGGKDVLKDETGTYYIDKQGEKFEKQPGTNYLLKNGQPVDDQGREVVEDPNNPGTWYVKDGKENDPDVSKRTKSDGPADASLKLVTVTEDGYFEDSDGNLIKDSDGNLARLMKADELLTSGDLWGWGNKLNNEGIPENFNTVYPDDPAKTFQETGEIEPVKPTLNDQQNGTNKYTGEDDPNYQKDLAKYNEKKAAYDAKKEWYEYFQNVKTLNKMAEEEQYADLGMGMEEITDADGNTKLVGSTVYNNALPGIKMLGYGIDEDGDPKNLVLLMKEFGELLSTCDEQGDYPNYGDKEKAFRLLGKYDQACEVTLSGYTYIDVQGKFLQSNGSTLDEQSYNLNEQRSSLEDVDVADAISMFMWDYACYSANLKIGTQLLSESLIDYMR